MDIVGWHTIARNHHSPCVSGTDPKIAQQVHSELGYLTCIFWPASPFVVRLECDEIAVNDGCFYPLRLIFPSARDLAILKRPDRQPFKDNRVDAAIFVVLVVLQVSSVGWLYKLGRRINHAN